MKREKMLQCLVTDEEYNRLLVILIERGIKTGKALTISSYLRELLLVSMNGKQDTEQEEVLDDKQDTKQGVVINFDDIEI